MVTVGVLLGMSVSVGVGLGVIEGVNEGITKEVNVGTGVDVGRLVGWFMSCEDSGVAVQVAGSERGVAVSVGMLIKIVGNAVGRGKGFNELLSSNHINPNSPHKHTVDRIVNTDRMSQIDNFTAVDPFWNKNPEVNIGAATPVSIYYFPCLSRIVLSRLNKP